MKAFLVGMGLALASLANAHPLGNNTVNRQSGLALSPTTLTVDYRVDIAEIPTLLATTEADTDGDGSTSKAEWATTPAPTANASSQASRCVPTARR